MKKYFYSILVITIFAVGFGASDFSDLLFTSSMPGTYNLEGGYVISIDDDYAVRLKTPKGKVYKGRATNDFDVHATIDLNDDIHINNLYGDEWTIDEDIKYIYLGGSMSKFITSKDEDYRIKIVSYSN